MKPPHRDDTGLTLADYPRPSVAVDTAVFAMDSRHGLSVLEVRRNNGSGWALPGTFLYPQERLADAVERSMRIKANVCGLNPRQLHVFDRPDRDPRGWVLSVAHLAVVLHDRLADRWPGDTRLMPATAPGRLPYDHPEIIDRALTDLRERYLLTPDPDGLLDEQFTMRELLQAHAAVLGYQPQRDWFRRTMEPQLAATGVTVAHSRGRPAELFCRLRA